MKNIFLIDPFLDKIETEIVAVRPMGPAATAIALAQTVIRPAGGGQPGDHGAIASSLCTYEVMEMSKADGQTWLTLATNGAGVEDDLKPGAKVVCTIDLVRRRNLTRCHTLTHVLMAGIRRNVEGYASCGAEIEEDASTCRLWFASTSEDPAARLNEIDMFARSVIAQDLPVNITNVKSPEHAREIYPHWRVDPALNLSGKIRVVDIPTVDCNPCSGTHVRSTAEIGPYTLDEIRYRPDRGCFELRATRTDAWLYWYGG